MAAARIQSKTYASNDWLNSHVFSFTSSVTSGSLLVVGIATGNSTSSVTSLTDSAGQTWTRAIQQLSLDSVPLEIWYLANANAGTHTITIAMNDYYQMAAVAREYGGVATTIPLDVTKAAADGDYESAHLSGTSTTTSQANTLSVMFSGGFENGGTYTAGTGFGNVQYIASSGSMSVGMCDRDDSSVGTKDGTINSSNFVRNGNGLVIFKEPVVAATGGMLGLF